VSIHDDDVAEDTEQFSVRLSAPTGGALIGPRSTITFTIVDDDPPPTIPPPVSQPPTTPPPVSQPPTTPPPVSQPPTTPPPVSQPSRSGGGGFDVLSLLLGLVGLLSARLKHVPGSN
jgi:hypothetical protein